MGDAASVVSAEHCFEKASGKFDDDNYPNVIQTKGNIC